MEQVMASQEPNSAAAWRAVERRDRSQDGRFVYAVSSTGVYCRPSCPSRRPRRENVRFFAEGRAAEAAGYRACRRCRPNEAGPDATMRRVEEARRYLDARPDERVGLGDLARVVGASPAHVQRTFKAALGMSPRAYQAALRMSRLKSGLKQGKPVTAALYEAGFGSSSRLYEGAGAELGMTPGAYRRGGLGVRIAYATTVTPLGRLLLAATGRGVCAVAFGDSDTQLEAGLREEYPRAEIVKGGAELDAWIEAVRASLAGSAALQDVPLDAPGSPFQQRVWNALRQIPAGSTRSYGQVAEALGQPSAVRAVAQACARNHVALLIPCHRVVRGDGQSGGYRWGAARKARLLEQERERARRTA